jgi:hypothetical protein
MVVKTDASMQHKEIGPVIVLVLMRVSIDPEPAVSVMDLVDITMQMTAVDMAVKSCGISAFEQLPLL